MNLRCVTVVAMACLWHQGTAKGQVGENIQITNSIGMKLRLIKAGEFVAGTTVEPGETNLHERLKRRVEINHDYYLGVTEVTSGQWEAVMHSRPWKDKANTKEGPNYPATYVSWNDATVFCDRLSQKEGIEYRLPTALEWEYACRAGTTTEYSFGDDSSKLKEYAWFGDLNEGGAHVVGTKRPNPWGLYDMHGNVWEWCQDWFCDPPEKLFRTIHGGSWDSYSPICRSGLRGGGLPDGRCCETGFRVVRAPVAK